MSTSFLKGMFPVASRHALINRVLIIPVFKKVQQNDILNYTLGRFIKNPTMSEELILQGKVMWSYDYEIEEFTSAQKIMSGLTGIGGPIHNHKGNITLTNEQVLIESEDSENLSIPLASVTQLYIGFDDIYTKLSVKNAGLFWQPLRLEYTNANYQIVRLYTIIDYKLLYSDNQRWYDSLISILQ